MILTDTHCHLDLEQFDSDRADVLSRAWEAGLTRILIPGLTLASSSAAVHLAESHPNLFAAVGVHPNDALTWDEGTLPGLRQLAGSPRVRAIGEIGLDYYWKDAPPGLQQKVLTAQLALAAELQLPVVLHLRETGDAAEGPCASDLLNILSVWVKQLAVEKNPLAARPGVLHSFSGSLPVARQALQLNFMIGLTGPLTYKNAENKRQVAAGLPLDRLLIETDAPFLAPVPRRGMRNEPAFVRHIADKIAEIHSRNPEEIATLTAANAERLFVWGGII